MHISTNFQNNSAKMNEKNITKKPYHFFSPEEQKVWDEILSLMDQWNKIPPINRDSRGKEFVQGIHLLQDTILFVALKRNHPELGLT